MNPLDQLKTKLARLQKYFDRGQRLVDKEFNRLEELYAIALSELEKQKKLELETIAAEEMKIRGEMDIAGKEFARKKYQLERDTLQNKNEIARLEEENVETEKKHASALVRLNEEKVNQQISLDRQISALKDLYEEKRRHLNVTRASLQQQWKTVDENFRKSKEKVEKEFETQRTEGLSKMAHLREQSEAKKAGWNAALEAIKRELDGYAQEKTHLEKRLSEIQGEKEKELESLQLAMALSKEQLDIDKATLIERAEDDQRKCEAEIADLKHKIESKEHELASFVDSSDKKKKDVEESFVHEEQTLKEAVKTESEKRDYEQKLYEQEKAQKEKQVVRLREDYEKKKWHWDNQVRSLMMQKGVQDAEHDAERMRVDREARTVLRGLEAKRDELKQRLADVKSRHEALAANAQKENDLVTKRWHWRRDRLWTLWQNRLDVLKKERAAIQLQLEALQEKFDSEKNKVSDGENKETQRESELQSFILQMSEKNQSQKKQKEIQNELEKTRILAQIKECETLIGDWVNRLQDTQEEIAKNNMSMIQQVNYLDRWYREEERETQLFLQTFQKALSVFQSAFSRAGLKDAA